MDGIKGPYIVGSVLYNDDAKICAFVRSRLVGDCGVDWDNCKAIGVVRNGTVVGGVVFHNYRPHAADIEFSAAFSTPRWCMPDTFRQILRYPMIQLGCTRATARTGRRNKRARQFLERLGFRVEGVQRKALDGRQDIILYGVLLEQFAWKGR